MFSLTSTPAHHRPASPDDLTLVASGEDGDPVSTWEALREEVLQAHHCLNELSAEIAQQPRSVLRDTAQAFATGVEGSLRALERRVRARPVEAVENAAQEMKRIQKDLGALELMRRAIVIAGSELGRMVPVALDPQGGHEQTGRTRYEVSISSIETHTTPNRLHDGRMFLVRTTTANNLNVNVDVNVKGSSLHLPPAPTLADMPVRTGAGVARAEARPRNLVAVCHAEAEQPRDMGRQVRPARGFRAFRERLGSALRSLLPDSRRLTSASESSPARR
ncbi:hypothetical protein [Roseateles sp.]|uniref:hypothetical protein n=1 Tax=Roseateles sp. TaxID=1971397 RepID=UPI0031D59084